MDIIFVGGEPFKPVHWPFHIQCLSSSLLLLSLHEHHWIRGIQLTLNSWKYRFFYIYLQTLPASSSFLGTYYSSILLLVPTFCLSPTHLGHAHILGAGDTIQHIALSILHPVSFMVLALRLVTHKYLLKWRTKASAPLFTASSFASIQGSHHLPDTAGWMSPPPLFLHSARWSMFSARSW